MKVEFDLYDGASIFTTLNAETLTLVLVSNGDTLSLVLNKENAHFLAYALIAELDARGDDRG